MEKLREIAEPASCFNRALNNEIVFVLLGRDEAAPAAIRTWCDARVKLGKNTPFDAQIMDALICAENMGYRREDIRAAIDNATQDKTDKTSVEIEAKATLAVITPEILKRIADNEMPECFQPTAGALVALARLLCRALDQNEQLVLNVLSGQPPGRA